MVFNGLALHKTLCAWPKAGLSLDTEIFRKYTRSSINHDNIIEDIDNIILG